MPQNENNNQTLSPVTTGPTLRTEMGTLARAGLVVVLTLTLVGAMRWAMNITNANAREVSNGLTRLQNKFGQDAPEPSRGIAPNKRAPVAPGPTIDALDK